MENVRVPVPPDTVLRHTLSPSAIVISFNVFSKGPVDPAPIVTARAWSTPFFLKTTVELADVVLAITLM